MSLLFYHQEIGVIDLKCSEPAVIMCDKSASVMNFLHVHNMEIMEGPGIMLII